MDSSREILRFLPLAVFLLFFVSTSHGALPLLDKLKESVNILDNGVNGTAVKTQIKSAGPNVAKAKKLLYLTSIVLCGDNEIQSWNCTHCLKAKENGYEFGALIQNKATNTLALLSVNKAAKEIVVCYRATYNLQNILQDAQVNQVPFGGGGGKGKKGGKKGGKGGKKGGKKGKGGGGGGGSGLMVHAGFKEAADSLWADTVKALEKLLKANSGFSVVFSGHSLGSSMAIINLYKFKNSKNAAFAKGGCNYVGYGTPRTGNKAFADYWNNLKGCSITRVRFYDWLVELYNFFHGNQIKDDLPKSCVPATNQKAAMTIGNDNDIMKVSRGDVVPHMPTVGMGYFHHGTEVWNNLQGEDKSCSKSVYEDPKCSNSLGPLYNPQDHLKYWDVDYTVCAANNPAAFLSQVVLPLNLG